MTDLKRFEMAQGHRGFGGVARVRDLALGVVDEDVVLDRIVAAGVDEHASSSQRVA